VPQNPGGSNHVPTSLGSSDSGSPGWFFFFFKLRHPSASTGGLDYLFLGTPRETEPISWDLHPLLQTGGRTKKGEKVHLCFLDLISQVPTTHLFNGFGPPSQHGDLPPQVALSQLKRGLKTKMEGKPFKGWDQWRLTKRQPKP